MLPSNWDKVVIGDIVDVKWGDYKLRGEVEFISRFIVGVRGMIKGKKYVNYYTFGCKSTSIKVVSFQLEERMYNIMLNELK